MVRLSSSLFPDNNNCLPFERAEATICLVKVKLSGHRVNSQNQLSGGVERILRRHSEANFRAGFPKVFLTRVIVSKYWVKAYRRLVNDSYFVSSVP
jgi:hypothetical protein